jgi:hypothetical protein
MRIAVTPTQPQMIQEVLGRANRLLSFNTTRTVYIKRKN